MARRAYTTRWSRSGFTVAELLVSVAVFSLLIFVCVAALSQANKVLLNSTGRDGAIRELAKAHAALVADLQMTRLSAATFQQIPQTDTQRAGFDGDCINFLTPMVPSTSQAAYGPDGSAFWMRNVAYAMIVPLDHNTLFDWTCPGVKDAYGYDDGCPHKILIRQVTDQNNSTPSNPATVQTLLKPFGPFASQTGYPRSATLSTVATNLITFRCTQPIAGQLTIDIRALSFNDAYKAISIGSTPLSPTRFMVEQTFSVFPMN